MVGALNTLSDFSIFYVLTTLGMWIWTANIVSTSVALSLSFVLNKNFTFGSQNTGKRTFIKFLIFTVAGLWLLQPVIIYLLLMIFGDSHLAVLGAKAGATIASMMWNYITYSRYVFKNKASNE
jgi:putative flippase GtrA